MSTNEMGTYFIAYASTFSTVKKMLEAMFIASPEGNYDRLLDFSTAKTGSLFFAPSESFLKSVADGEPAVEVVHSAASRAAGSSNGSLSIGSLKKESGYE
jgi:putative iron-dependent peroxidase